MTKKKTSRHKGCWLLAIKSVHRGSSSILLVNFFGTHFPADLRSPSTATLRIFSSKEREISLSPELTQSFILHWGAVPCTGASQLTKVNNHDDFVQQMINYDRESVEAHVRVPQSLADLAPPPSWRGDVAPASPRQSGHLLFCSPWDRKH